MASTRRILEGIAGNVAESMGVREHDLRPRLVPSRPVKTRAVHFAMLGNSTSITSYPILTSRVSILPVNPWNDWPRAFARRAN